MEPTFQVLPPGPPPSKPSAKGFLSGLGVIGVLALKFGFLALKGLGTALSMFIMIWVYSRLFGWRFAVGIVLLIFVHEMGHVIAAKWLGMPVSAPIFIPFVGAYITMKRHPRDAWTEAWMAYGGPLAGGLGAWACLIAAESRQLPWVMAVASFTFVMNLFNLIPVPPLDGGRICAAVSTWFWFLGLLLLGAAVFYFHSTSSIFLIILILFVALPRLKQTLLSRHSPQMEQYYATHIGRRFLMAFLYLGLIAVLLLGYLVASQWLSDFLINGGDSSST